MNERGKSDGPVVPAKPPNNAAQAATEAVEERGPAEGNAAKQNAPRTQSRARRAKCAGSRTSGHQEGHHPSLARDSTSTPKAGAQCVRSARWDLRRGPPATAVPTAIELEQRAVFESTRKRQRRFFGVCSCTWASPQHRPRTVGGRSGLLADRGDAGGEQFLLRVHDQQHPAALLKLGCFGH
jgi:hypothetical protein